MARIFSALIFFALVGPPVGWITYFLEKGGFHIYKELFLALLATPISYIYSPYAALVGVLYGASFLQVLTKFKTRNRNLDPYIGAIVASLLFFIVAYLLKKISQDFDYIPCIIAGLFCGFFFHIKDNEKNRI